MHFRTGILLIAAVAWTGCHSHAHDRPQALTLERRAAVQDSVRAFVLNVALDITQDGPTAWRKEFSDSPSFFMAANGKLTFPDSQSATQGIQDLPRVIKHITLQWGSDLRVDPLTPDLAVVASSYTEVLTDPEGHQMTTDGFFTGVAEFRDGRWTFRNAHWSMPATTNP
jgi:hypothetical protein